MGGEERAVARGKGPPVRCRGGVPSRAQLGPDPSLKNLNEETCPSSAREFRSRKLPPE